LLIDYLIIHAFLRARRSPDRARSASRDPSKNSFLTQITVFSIFPTLIIVNGESTFASSDVVQQWYPGGPCINNVIQNGSVSSNQDQYRVVPVKIDLTCRGIQERPFQTKWIIADCNQQRLGLWASDESGDDAAWHDVNHNSSYVLPRLIAEQWTRLCK